MPTARSRILTAATQLFAERGYFGTSLAAVAEAAGMRAPSLLYHFASKELLRDAVLEDLLARWKDVVPRLLTAATTGRDRFDGVLGELVRFFEADPARARLLMREALDRPEAIRALIATHLAPWMSLLCEFIELGQSEGRIHADLDPEAYVTEVVLLAVSHHALAPLTLAITPVPGWTARRAIEFRRLCNAALYRPRPESDDG